MDTLPYYMVLFAAAIPALVTHAKRPMVGWILFYLVLLLFVGLRFQVGSDWGGYLYLADYVEGMSLHEVFAMGDPLFFLVLWASVETGMQVYGANLVTSAIFLWGVFAYCRRMPNPWLAIYSAVPFLVIVVGMSANRQAAAIGVTLYLLASWEKSSILRRLVVVSVAVGFHASAIIFLLLFVIDSRLSLLKKMLGMGVVIVAAVYFAGSGSMERYTESYIVDADTNAAAGALQHILLNAIPGLYVLLRRKSFRGKLPQPQFILPMAVLSLALIPLAFVYSLIGARISFYVFPVSISVLSSLPSLPRDAQNRNVARYLIVLYGGALLAIWLTFANHAYNHKPYGNFLWL